MRFKKACLAAVVTAAMGFNQSLSAGESASAAEAAICADWVRQEKVFNRVAGSPESIRAAIGRGRAFVDDMYDIYEVDVNPSVAPAAGASALRQLTRDTKAENTEPCYLPDGRIVFTSSRDGRMVQCGDWALVFGLFTMNPDGSDVRSFTQPQDSEFYPSVLDGGRILFTRWDYVMKSYNVIQQLWSVFPDGTRTQLAYGDWYSFSRGPIALFEARQIPATTQVVAVGAAHHNTCAGPIMMVDLSQNRGGPAGFRNITPEVGYPECAPLWDERTDKTVPDIRAIDPVNNPTGWYAAPWPLAENLFLCNYSFETADHTDAYGIYLIDTHGNKELVYRAAGTSCYAPIPLKARTPPLKISLMPKPADPAAPGRLFVQDVQIGLDGVAPGTVKWLRVCETYPKYRHTNPHRVDVGVGSGYDMRGVLGVVPVEKDGSASFEVPSGKMIFLEALDKDYLEVCRMRHGERVADVRSNADRLEVLFIGDSITGGWRDIGKAVWEKEWVPLHVVNIGIAGSQTANILWQFENGAIDGIRPHVAVLMIGVNNVMAAPDQSAADIAGGVSTIVSRLREKLPNTRILLLGTFPKDKVPGTPDRRKIQEINALIAKLDDGKWIRFLDIRSQLLDKDGNLNAEVSPDGVHLTENGYQKWAQAIRPVVCEMMAPSHGFLTPESLAMLRRQIALKGTDLRLFNARGSVTFRERTVTGIDELFIAPRAVSRVPVSFNLSFREETLGALIEDNQDEWGEGTLNVWQHWNPANKELGIYKGWGDALILPSQRATWAPDAYTRRGTFHHYLGKDLISFGVITRTVPAADVDGAYEELTITNRTDRPLSLTLIPDQPRGDKKRSACFSRREGSFSLQALCDIGPSKGDGWRLDLPARGQRIVHVALLVADAGTAEPAGHYAADLAARFAASRQATLDLLRRAAAQLPRIETGNPRLDAFYQRSILSLLQCRRDRADSPIRPFYDIGFGDGNSVTWDVSFSASLLTLFAPDEAKRMLTAFLSAGGVFNSTWLGAKGGGGGFYMQSPFALLDIAQRYMHQTGNRTLLDEKAAAKTVFEHFRDGAQTLLDSYVKDGLIDAGEGTSKLLEIRTSGYEHTVAAIKAA